MTMILDSSSTMAFNNVIDSIMSIHKSLPTRPGIEEVEAAKKLILNIDKEVEIQIMGLLKQRKGENVSEELFTIFQEMQRNMFYFQGKKRKEEALKMLDLESAYQLFDEMVERALKCLPGNSESVNVVVSSSRGSSCSSLCSTITNNTSDSSLYDERKLDSSPLCFSTFVKKPNMFSYAEDDTFVKKPNMFSSALSFSQDNMLVKKLNTFSYAEDETFVKKSKLMSFQALGEEEDGEKMSLIKLASYIEVSAKKGTRELSLQGKLSEKIEWLPDSIGKLSTLTKLDLSENKIAVLPDTIGVLSSLQMLDLHGNKIAELPASIGDLVNLISLDLRGNHLKSLPPTVSRLSRLQELDLSCNGLSALPDTIGSLVSLKKLNVETNDIEEIPHTISQCTSLKELHADYNRLKALPEAVGRIGSLEILTVRYNNIKQLPTTMASLTSIRELDISFNELEYVPESLCFATTLVKMNISNNFADMQTLPRSIGNLEMLEELDMSNNQIRVLPVSFGLLTNLSKLNVEGNPLAVLPRNVIEKGPQAIVQYMADLAAQIDVKSQQPIKQKKTWSQICFFSRSNKRKRNVVDYADS